MFCSKCGTEIPDGSIFCSKCGNKIAPIVESTSYIKIELNEQPSQKVMLDPNELSEQSEKIKDSGQTMSGSGKALGIVLMIAGGLCDIITMFMVGSSSFESFKFVTIAGTISFVLGLILTMVG